MKRTVPVLMIALLLAGCTAPPATPDSGTSSGNASAPESVSTSAPAPTSAPASTPEPPEVDYDEIRMILCESPYAAELREGYFTMSRDGLWGLMRADGTEVLPCEAQNPVSVCGALGQWHWDVYKTWDEMDALSEKLQAAGDGALCAGHGGAGHSFFYDLDAPGRDPEAVDLSALRCLQGGTPSQAVPMKDAYWDYYGDILPVYSAHEDPEGEPDMVWPGPMVEETRGDGQLVKWWYICRDGTALYPANLDRAGWFFDEALAPVETGGGWAYLNRSGELATEAIYEPVCTTAFAKAEEAPVYGAPLQNEYAVVCRDGKWGLLGADGTEVIPCEKEGIAWEGTTLWMKEGEGWHQMEIPSA